MAHPAGHVADPGAARLPPFLRKRRANTKQTRRSRACLVSVQAIGIRL
jgi:hypothetical protein